MLLKIVRNIAITASSMNFIVKTKYNASHGEMGAFTLLTDYFKKRFTGKIKENNFDNNILRLNDLCYLTLNYFFLTKQRKKRILY